MARGLTAKTIENLKAGAQRREVPDPAQRGLYVIVQPSGRKGYAVRYRSGGVTRKLTLQAGISLAAARKAAADAMHAVAQGIDPAVAKLEAKAKAEARNSDSLQFVCEEYFSLDSAGKKLRTAAEQQKRLARHVFPTFGRRAIGSIRRGEIVQLLDKIERTSGQRTADLALSYLHRIMGWYAVRNENFAMPFVKGMKRQKASERARSRILSDDELRAVWKAAANAGPFGSLVRFLILTACRRSEASHLPWSEIAGDCWLLAPERNKTKQPLTRPLSAAAQAVLAAQPRVGPYVFTTNGRTGISSYSKFKRLFDAASKTSGWQLHDLRRTSRSLLSRAAVPADHAEKCLGHVLPGVRGVYDRHRYTVEMLHAYEALAALIDRIVNPPPADNVVHIATARP